MKKFCTLILLFFVCIGLSCCNLRHYEDFEDNYVDTLPENAQDGLTLHAFNWTYKQIEDNLENIAQAGFKNVLTMPVQEPKSHGSAWWAFYQPLSFSIGNYSVIGNKEDLKSLCTKAEEYGICILADVVVNHMANDGDNAIEEDGTPRVYPGVGEYEPVLYNNRNEDTDGNGVTFHHNRNAAGTGSETQVYQWGNLPDLNTANPYVQSRVLSLLKECIDVGVDGFRFDAAKHVETGRDEDYPSDFWIKTLGEAKQYYKEKTGKDLYAYGEILGYPLSRPLSYYTGMMIITDDSFVAQFKNCMAKKNPEMILNATLKDNPENLIAWVESHDEYVTSSSHYSDQRVAKYWSVIAAKKGLGGLYLSRPVDGLIVGQEGSHAFENEYVSTANRFHNRFYNGETYESAHDKVYINEKVKTNDQGAMIIYVDEVDTNKAIDVNLPHLIDGNYYDALTGNKVVVSNHKAKIKFDSNGISFLLKSKNVYPQYTISDRGGYFNDDKQIDIKVKNVDKAYYYFNDNINNKHSFKDAVSIDLKDNVIDGKVVLHLHLESGNKQIDKEFIYHKMETVKDKFSVINLKQEYFDNYEIYIWSWSPSKWSKDYEIVDGNILVDTTGMDGFLIAVFEKGYEIKDLYKWDSGVLKQSADIAGEILKQGYIDMSGF